MTLCADCGHIYRSGRSTPGHAERFWSKVDKSGDCWLWTGALTPKGYGQWAPHYGMTPIRAHRFAYEQLVGPIPDGLDLDHLCRVRNCVNPAHLEPVTSVVNTLRGVGQAAINARKTHCKYGHNEWVMKRRKGRPSYRACRPCARAASQDLRLRSRGQDPTATPRAVGVLSEAADGPSTSGVGLTP